MPSRGFYAREIASVRSVGGGR